MAVYTSQNVAAVQTMGADTFDVKLNLADAAMSYGAPVNGFKDTSSSGAEGTVSPKGIAGTLVRPPTSSVVPPCVIA